MRRRRPGGRVGFRGQPVEDGGLRVELNARQEEGPVVTVKKLLLALGLDEGQAARVGVTREMLVLRSRGNKPAPCEQPSAKAIT